MHTTELSGSGLAYYLSLKLLSQLNADLTENIKELLEDHVLFAAIGSVADMVSVTTSTRNILFHGIKRALQTHRPGLRLLFDEKKLISPTDISFTIAPKINVFGRIDDPMDALRLLCTKNDKKAKNLLEKALKLVDERRRLTKNFSNLKDEFAINDAIVAIVSDEIEEGVIGLIASDSMKRFDKPAFVICRSDGFYKGSIRSVLGVDCAQLLNKLGHYTESSGGHAMAGGFVIQKDKIDSFLMEANKLVSKIKRSVLTHVEVDIVLSILQTRLDLAKTLMQLSPFGIGNPTPLFASLVTIAEVTAMGKAKQHARVVSRESGISIDFVYFNGHSKAKDLVGKNVSIIYELDVNEWGGVEKAQRKVIDIIP